MARIKKELTSETPIEIKQEDPKEALIARRNHLLNIFKLIQDERVAVPAQLEVKLSQVNEELNKLGE